MYPFFFLDRLGQHPVGLCVVRRNKALMANLTETTEDRGQKRRVRDCRPIGE